MDPFAHTLVGATLAETGLKKKTPLATATLMLGANAPDIDAFVMVLGNDTSLLLRRGHTHGVIALVVLPILLAGAMMAYDRVWRLRRSPDKEAARWWPLLGLAYLSTLTHPVLDWMNTYGVRLLMPFDGTWFYGDALFIIDPWLWLLMAAAVVLARSQGKLSIAAWVILATGATTLIGVSGYAPWPAEVLWLVGVALIVVLRFRGATAKVTQSVALACVSVSLVYIGAMVWGSAVARTQSRAWLKEQGVEVREVMAGPLPANPFIRDVVAVTGDEYRFFRVDWLANQTISETHARLPGDLRNAVINAARSAESVRGMVNWLRYPSYVVEEIPSGYRVTINDMRYAYLDAPIGTAVVELDHDLRPR